MIENTKKYAFHLYPSMIEEMEKSLDLANATSKSDFVRQAVNFYIRYLHLRKSMNLVAPLLEQTVHDEAESVERNLSEMLFKVAVELGIVSKAMCSAFRFDEEALAQLRKEIAKEVASTNGVISFEQFNDGLSD